MADMRQGVAAAQACENEIDDDLTHYRECVGHASNRWHRKSWVLMGLHAQAWSMADLAARQHATAALGMRAAQAQRVSALQKQLRLSWPALCAAMQWPCPEVQVRWAQHIDPP